MIGSISKTVIIIFGFCTCVGAQSTGGVRTTPFLERGGGILGNNAKAYALLNELRSNQAGGQISLTDIKGSMYFEEAYQEGSIYMGKELFGDFPMRYNGFTDEIEVEKAKGLKTQSVFKTNSLQCIIGDEKYVLKDYLDQKGNLVQGYLVELSNKDQYLLYQKKTKVFKEGKTAQTSLHRDTPHKFIDSESFYVQYGDKYPIYLKNSKKALKAIFDEKDLDKVKRYIKENGIKLNDKDALLLLFDNIALGI